jgi:hypothetical protein
VENVGMGGGRRVVLLGDRGWSLSVGTSEPVHHVSDGVGRAGLPDIWAMTSVEDIMETACVVVGPDERRSKAARMRTWRPITGPS